MGRPQSIREIGLKKHLNSNIKLHNGFDYKSFTRMVDTPHRPSVASMGRIFNVSDITIRKWIAIYELEKKS